MWIAVNEDSSHENIGYLFRLPHQQDDSIRLLKAFDAHKLVAAATFACQGIHNTKKEARVFDLQMPRAGSLRSSGKL